MAQDCGVRCQLHQQLQLVSNLSVHVEALQTRAAQGNSAACEPISKLSLRSFASLSGAILPNHVANDSRTAATCSLLGS